VLGVDERAQHETCRHDAADEEEVAECGHCDGKVAHGVAAALDLHWQVELHEPLQRAVGDTHEDGTGQ